MKRFRLKDMIKRITVLISAALALYLFAFCMRIFVVTGELAFDRDSGFYDGSFYLQIRGGGRIYYTLDGTEPDEDSLRYTHPIKIDDASKNPNVYSAIRETSPNLVPDFADIIGVANTRNWFFDIPDDKVDKATIVRAVRIDEEGEKSEVITEVYFVGMQEKSGYDNYGVISILTDPDDLFDEENGRYMIGSACLENAYKELAKKGFETTRNAFDDANFMQKGKKNRVPAQICIWDEDKNLTKIQNVKISIQGHTGRFFPKKSFNIYSTDGDDLEYCGHRLDSLNLFSGSQDARTMMLDMLINKWAGDLKIATRHYTPYQVFLDGEYWGLYELTERFDESYFSEYYGIDDDDIIFLKRSSGVEDVELGDDGDAAYFEEIKEYAITHDLSQQEYCDAIFEKIDYESFLDYYACQMYLAHFDWPDDNFGLFKSRKNTGKGYNDGKFRFVLYDLNMVSVTEFSDDIREYMQENDPFFNALWENENIRNALNERIEYMGENVFDPDVTNADIDELKNIMFDAMMKEYSRQYNGTRTEKNYRCNVDTVKNLFTSRYRYIKGLIEDAGKHPDGDE